MTARRSYPPLSDLISLAGRRAVVTGGAAGLGLAICRRMAEAGAEVLVADIDGEGAEKAARELEAAGRRATSVQCDVSREEAVRNMVRTAVERMGGIDILVNNAGVYPRIPLPQMKTEEFEAVLAVNLRGTFLCSREASVRMIEQGRGGCIINIGSIDSVHPSASELAAYDASKGGVLMLTKSMARELGQHDIRVNAIAPGGIMTGAIASHTTESSKEEARAQLRELKAFMARMVLGRMGEADEIGRVALFLASDLASYMTGSLVVVDGGYLIS